MDREAVEEHIDGLLLIGTFHLECCVCGGGQNVREECESAKCSWPNTNEGAMCDFASKVECHDACMVGSLVHNELFQDDRLVLSLRVPGLILSSVAFRTSLTNMR